MHIETNVDVDKEKIVDIVNMVMKTVYIYVVKWTNELRKEMAEENERYRQEYKQ